MKYGTFAWCLLNEWITFLVVMHTSTNISKKYNRKHMCGRPSTTNLGYISVCVCVSVREEFLIKKQKHN